MELSTSIRIDLGTLIGVIYDFSLLIFFSTSLPIFSNLRHHYRRHAPSFPFSPILFFPFFLFFIYLPFFIHYFILFLFPKNSSSLTVVGRITGQSPPVSPCRPATSSIFLSSSHFPVSLISHYYYYYYYYYHYHYYYYFFIFLYLILIVIFICEIWMVKLI